MKIKNINGLSPDNLQTEVMKGGRFIYYPYVISLILVTFKRTSGVYLVRGNKSARTKAWPFLLISVLFGWWGFPFGPKYTLESIRTNMKGGKDVTDEVMATVAGHILFQEAQMQKKIHQ
ncbi:MAG: hypothetical protein SGI83_18630 [Bacteroidota bacterium]|nr:hypothetical protein [Bacteroidota bacterium]